MADYYPLMLKLQGKRCVVVGGGDVAERKVRALLECGASVTVISPDLASGLRELEEKGEIEIIPRRYRAGDLRGALLAVSAADDSEVNGRVSKEGQRRGILVNVVDDPEKSDFIVPSMLRRGDLVIAVSTSGQSPALARRIRRDLEERYGEEYASLVLVISEVRSELKKRGVQVDGDVWQEALQVMPLLEMLRKKDRDGAKRRLLLALESAVGRGPRPL